MLTTDERTHNDTAGPVLYAPEDAPPLRLAVGLGDPAREQAILPALGEAGDLVVAERCLAAEPLIACARAGQVDVVLVAFDLHRLGATGLDELVRTRVPLVLLAPPDVAERTELGAGAVLPLDADALAVRAALHAAARGERVAVRSQTEPVERLAAPPGTDAAAPQRALSVLAIAGGYGSPGRTTVALNLAAALGAVTPTCLVDLDMASPSVAAYLDADVTRNLYMVAHYAPETQRDWDRVLAREAQPLAGRSRQGVVICGVPKPEMRGALTPGFLEQLVPHLRRRYQYALFDLGPDLLGPEAALHRGALGLADQVLLVASTDLVGLRRAKDTLAVLREQLGVDPARIALVLNQHDGRFGWGRTEIEWQLGQPTAAVIPHDHAGAARAALAQQPMVLDRRSRAGRAMLALAERLHGRDLELPPEPRGTGRSGWLARLARPRLPWARGRAPADTAAMTAVETGATDGDHAAAVP